MYPITLLGLDPILLQGKKCINYLTLLHASSSHDEVQLGEILENIFKSGYSP